MLLQFLLIAQSQRNQSTSENAVVVVVVVVVVVAFIFFLLQSSFIIDVNSHAHILQMLQFSDESICRHRMIIGEATSLLY